MYKIKKPRWSKRGDIDEHDANGLHMSVAKSPHGWSWSVDLPIESEYGYSPSRAKAKAECVQRYNDFVKLFLEENAKGD